MKLISFAFNTRPFPKYMITACFFLLWCSWPVCSLRAQQQVGVSGTVSDAQTNETLPGVNILVKDTSTGASTDSDGNYELMVESLQDTLVVSFVGYKTQQVPIDGRTEIDVALQTQAISGEEMVVVGYGTQKKKNLTASVDQVNSDVFEDRATISATESLQGSLPGVYISKPTGSPTQTYSPVVRGIGSIGAGGRALVMVDGVPGSLEELNPNDIKSVTVLKDASAAAIYGSRGAMGVILVETKKPEHDEMTIDYSFNYSLNDRTIHPDFVTGYKWAKNFNDAYTERFKTPPTTVNTSMGFSQAYVDRFKELSESGEVPKVETDPANGKYVYYGNADYQDYLFKDFRPSIQHNLSVSGSSNKLKYYVSGRYVYQKGLIRLFPDNYHQYNLRAKGSIPVFKWLEVSNNFSLSHRDYFRPLYNASDNKSVFGRIYGSFPPISFFKNPDGSYTRSTAFGLGGYGAGHQYKNQNWNTYRNIASFKADFLDNNLEVHGDFAYSFSNYLQNQIHTPIPYSDKPNEVLYVDPVSRASRDNDHTNYIGTNLYLDYGRSFNKHSFKIKLGFNYENTDRKNLFYQRNGLINEDLYDPSLLSGDDITLKGGGYEWTTVGEFFRLNYNYADKYLLEFNGRYDGSSKFPFNQQYGFFPSASAAWNISEEPFWNVSSKGITNLKLRASYGALGNGNVEPYQFLPSIPASKANRIIDGSVPISTSNPNVVPAGLSWEKVTSANIGIDLALLSGQLNVTFDKYIRTTNDMFTQSIPLPGVFGASEPKGNFGSMKTNGWELSIGFNNFGRKKGLQYDLKFTLSDNHSVITEYNNPKGIITDYYKGKSLGTIWGYEVDGLYQSKEEVDNAPDQSKVPANISYKNELKVGDVKFVDRNGDGEIDPGSKSLDDHGDLKEIGNSTPRYLFGFNGTLKWHNFMFSAFIQGVGKRDTWFGRDAALFWGQYNRPYQVEPKGVYEKQWSPDNPDAYFPRNVGYIALASGLSGRALGVPSDRYLQNSAYVRLKHVTIGYELPIDLISQIGMSSAKFFIGGENLWVWTPYFKIVKSIDPENIHNRAQAQSETYLGGSSEARNKGNVYPLLRKYTIGISIKF